MLNSQSREGDFDAVLLWRSGRGLARRGEDNPQPPQSVLPPPPEQDHRWLSSDILVLSSLIK